MRFKNYLLILTLCISSFALAQITISDSIFSGGVYRTYVLYVPVIYNSANPVPLVFNIHGGTGDGNQQMQFGDFRPIADTANFIIVHPTGLGGNSPGWNLLGPTDSASIADRNFLFNLLDTLKSQYTINPNRVYSAGFSQGGLMGHLLSCFQNTRFAAIAAVSGGIRVANQVICAPTRPTPLIQIHGTADLISGYNGVNTLTPGGTPGVPVDSIIKYYVDFNHCNPIPVMTNIPNTNTTDNCNVERYVYSGGDQGASVELFKVISGGHAWPADVATGGTTNHAGTAPMFIGNRNMDINASKEIWRFFSQYTLMTVGTDEQVANSGAVLIYPNPSTGIFYIEFKNSRNANITVVNILGETVLEKTISNSSEIIDLSISPAGVYFYQVVNHTGIIKTGKLIIE